MSQAVMDDEQIIRLMIERAKKDGGLPGQNKLCEDYGIGKTRVVKLLAQADQRLAADRDWTGGPVRKSSDRKVSTVRTTPGPGRIGSGDTHQAEVGSELDRSGLGLDATQPIPAVSDRSDTVRSETNAYHRTDKAKVSDRTGPGIDAGEDAGPDQDHPDQETGADTVTGPDRDTVRSISATSDRSGPDADHPDITRTGPGTAATGPVQGAEISDRSGLNTGPDQAGPVRQALTGDRSTPRTGTDRTDSENGPSHEEAPDRSDRAGIHRSVRSAMCLGLMWAAGAAMVALLGYRIADTTIGRSVLRWLATLGPHRLLVVVGVAAGAAVATTAVTMARTQIRRGGRWSTRVFLAGAGIGLVVSGDTSWRFFGQKAGIDDVWERLALFAGVEVVLLACGVAMYERAKEGQGPGNARWLAWALSSVSGYAALTLDGFPAGPFRVAAGPVLAVLALHMAMGIEIRHARVKKTRNDVLVKIAIEVRERFLSRLGLGDETRDAASLTKLRAARRAAKLASGKGVVPFRVARLRRALLKADVADDPGMRRVVERNLAMLKHSGSLEKMVWDSPWEAGAIASAGDSEK